ncbi:MAG TPA: glutamine synthetase [Kineosporiaceae bacterium]|nr:glutamine synthetase [Kineosporiaceae bacterium]
MTTLADPVPGGRPGEVERAHRLVEELGARGVHGVVLAYVDTAGINRVKSVPLGRLPAVTRWGVGMSPVFDTFLADDSIVATEHLGTPDGDLRLYPDLDPLVSLAGQPGWAWAPVDRLTQDGTAHPGCSRTFLRHAVGQAAEQGYALRAAIEIEWAIGRSDDPEAADGGFVPACTGPAYGGNRLVELTDYAADLLAALAAQGVDVDQLHPEYAAGQFELSVAATDPVAAADRSVLVRQTIRAVGQRHGLRVSFAPSVVAGGVGNGGHVHVSVWRGDRNLHAGGDQRYGMTPEAEGFAAGVLAALPALSALATPSPSSYLRLQPSHWAGVYACWGHETREAALRLVTGMVGHRDRAANLEVKFADLAANPYLLLGGLVACGLAGLQRGLRLPPEVTGDPARLAESELADLGIRRLPTGIEESLREFCRYPVLLEALGPPLVEAITGVRRGEAARVAGLEPAAVAEAYRWVY